jgi:hypothetical protein
LTELLVARGASLIVCVDCGTAAAVALSAVAGLAAVIVLDYDKSEGLRLVRGLIRGGGVGSDIHVAQYRRFRQQHPQRRLQEVGDPAMPIPRAASNRLTISGSASRCAIPAATRSSPVRHSQRRLDRLFVTQDGFARRQVGLPRDHH